MKEYTKQNLTDFTTTYRPMNIAECVEEIIYHAKQLISKKWYQNKRYHIKAIKRYTNRIINIEKSCKTNTQVIN